MRTITFACSILLIVAGCGTSDNMEKSTEKTSITYAETFRGDHVDTLWGEVVPDPYRWLENDTSAETADWVKRQNAVTDAYLGRIPFREAIAKRYEDLFNFPKVSAPSKVGDKFFIHKNSGLQNQSVIYVREGMEGEDKVFIDPNAIDPAGTTSIDLMGASNDDRYMAVSVQRAGSDWQEIEIWDLTTMKKLDDRLEWVKFSGAAWYKDGFFYSRYPTPAKGTELSGANKDQKVYYHKVGTPQAQDVLVYDDPNADRYVGVGTTEGEEFATLYVSTGTDGFEMKYWDLRKGGIPGPAAKWTTLQEGFKQKTSIVDYVPAMDRFLVQTDVDAPRYRLVAVDPAKPGKAHWTEVIPEKEMLLEGVTTGGGNLFANYLKDVTTRIYRYKLDGTGEQEIQLPGLGSAGGFGGKRDDTYSFYSFTSFTDPGSSFKYDYATGESELYYRPELKFDPDLYTTVQVFYPSKDGTEVPLFIVHRKDLVKNGKNPTLLYGYGGFNISLSPSFSTSRIILLEQGGVFALANLRGGGEYGEDWHKAGMLMNKQNVFDDFIAAAEYLIDKNYTSPKRLAIQGGSNGGLLVGACMTQRPDLFRVALPAVGVMDMLRYQKFTAGFGWTPEYGSADDSKEMYTYLKGYSPVHNIKEGTCYPATLVMTADHDDRVVPAHSFKFAAELQRCQSCNNPALIRIETSAGHGAGKPTSKVIEEQADIWSFVFHNMDFVPAYDAPAAQVVE